MVVNDYHWAFTTVYYNKVYCSINLSALWDPTSLQYLLQYKIKNWS